MPLFRRKPKNDDDLPVDPEERSLELGIKYKDLMVLRELQKAGAALDQPREAIYFLYFPSRAAADAAAAEAIGQGFECAVNEPLPAYPGQWSLQCVKAALVLDPPTVRDNGNFFDALAGRHGGEYDGWEASV